jgi:hypothetical protein
MPDISMCNNVDCPLKESCYRNEASGTVPDLYQSYSAFYSKGCQDFIPVSGYRMSDAEYWEALSKTF